MGLKTDQRSMEIRRAVEELIALKGGGFNEDLVRDVIENALKLLHDLPHRGDMRILQTSIREMRYAFKLFAPFAGKRKVSIFGSARTKPDRPEYKQALDFAQKIREAGFMVITGAGPGIMQAGHEGAGPDASFGANIRLPWEQEANPVILRDKKLVTFKYFFTRKLTFMRQADAIVLFPGGFGTLDEGFEALTLIQTGKSRIMPVICVDRPGGTFWKSWNAYVRDHLLRNELISEDDLNLFQITDDVGRAVKWITRFYRNFHSCRFVKGKLVIRTRHPLTETAMQALNEDFFDIIKGEPFHITSASQEELDDEDHVDLPRIAFGFDNKQYGRLRELIDVLNNY